jgi:hypothetical protein
LPRTAAAFSMRSATDVFISARPTWQMF